MKEKITTQDVEERYSIKPSFQAKYRIAKNNPIPYTCPAGSKVVLCHKERFEQWFEKFSIADVA